MKYFIIITLLTAAAILGGAAEKLVFYSPLAGRWYSNNPEELTKTLKDFLAAVPEQKTSGNVIALIQPHAGYSYSGAVAAYGIKALNTQVKRVVILGPSHTAGIRDVITIPTATHIATVLGEIPIDQEFADKLRQHSFCKFIPRAHITEHSVDIQLPLLQMVLKDFKIVPVVVGQLSDSSVSEIAAALMPLLDKNTIIIASSDFTHYGKDYGYTPFPQDGQTAKNLTALDQEAINAITKREYKQFSEYLDRTEATICGQAPIKLLLKMLPPDSKGELIKYDTSGRMTGDFERSVSYASIVFSGSWQTPADSGPDDTAAALTDAEKSALLALAGKVISEQLNGNKTPSPEKLLADISPGLNENRGVFVTLRCNGKLRGCIGEILPSRPLYQAVAAQALNAAFKDWRFSPVTDDELEELEIEISVLTPPQTVDSYRDIVVGRDGVILLKAGCTAVFLPQVAPEQGWSRDEMLDNLALKAGLSANAWRDGAKFKTFQANIFNDKTIKH